MSSVSTRPVAVRDVRTRLAWLMFARLALSVLCLGLALGVDGLGPELPPAARRGLYWTVAFAFLATVVHGAWFGRLRRPVRFVSVQLATDVCIATSLVYFSGGRGSVFTFLYVLVVVYAAVMLSRRGALATAALSTLAYGAALAAVNAGWLPDFADSGQLPLSGLLGVWGIHAGALVAVGLLASALSRELEEAGLALDRSLHDLYRLRNLHQLTIDSLTSGLLTTDSNGRITSFNPEAERITGVPRAQALGRQADVVIPGLAAVVAAATVGDPVLRRSRMPYRNAAGEDLHLGVAASVLRVTDGEPAGHVVIFQDVTRVVAMEAELRRSERMAAVGELAAKIAHEIRNPLAAISGSIQILRPTFEAHGSQGEGEGDATPRRLVDIVLRETDRLNDLIHDFLHYARPRPARIVPLELGELVDDVGRMLESSLPPSVKLELEIEPGLRAAGDPDQLRQVLWNLCRNGLEALADGGGVLRVEAHATQAPPPQGAAGSSRNPEGGADGWVELVVSDTGAGIAPELQERIFEPFFTTKQEGTGLGLAMVHRIVEGHGGALQLHSELGRGTAFRVILPGSTSGEAQ